MKVGDLAKMHGGSRKTIYLALQVTASSVFVVSMKTGYRTWATKKAFEVISESR